MPDSFSSTTTTGYGSRIVNSIKGVVIGLILFVVSFGLLYWNEGRVDLSNIAKTATEISSATVSTDSSLTGKLISTTGVVNSDQIIGDNLFLNPDKFIAAEREVEMYSWIEKSESHSKTNTGGSETTETTYTYSKGWEVNPNTMKDMKIHRKVWIVTLTKLPPQQLEFIILTRKVSHFQTFLNFRLILKT